MQKSIYIYKHYLENKNRILQSPPCRFTTCSPASDAPIVPPQISAPFSMQRKPQCRILVVTIPCLFSSVTTCLYFSK